MKPVVQHHQRKILKSEKGKSLLIRSSVSGKHDCHMVELHLGHEEAATFDLDGHLKMISARVEKFDELVPKFAAYEGKKFTVCHHEYTINDFMIAFGRGHLFRLRLHTNGTWDGMEHHEDRFWEVTDLDHFKTPEEYLKKFEAELEDKCTKTHVFDEYMKGFDGNG